MSEALPDNAQDPSVPESEARSPISPPLQGTAPAWNAADDPASEAHDPTAATEGSEATVKPNTIGSSMTDTAELIGSAVGNAQRQWRRGLELVRRPARQTPAEEAAGRVEEAQGYHASQLMAELEEDFADARQEAAVRLDEWSNKASERFQQFRNQASTVLSRSRVRAQELANRYPLQTIATIAGIGFVLGLTIRLRRSHRG